MGKRVQAWTIVSMVWLIGTFAIVYGLLLFVLGFRLRGLKKGIEKAAA